MTRSALALSACLLTFCGTVSAQAFPPFPDPPGELEAIVYSPTAGALEWERALAVGSVVGYEITRDGEVLGVVDALSYVERSLRSGTSYRYEVVTIDDRGVRSNTAFVTLVTPRIGAPNPPPVSGTTLIPPGPPTALEAIAYSSTAGAVQWETGRSNRLVIGYEVRRDGEVLGVFDTRSYVERALTPGTSYDYEIVAIDIEGLRSPPASVTLVTPGTAPAASLAAPAELRAEVYSRRSAELFWRREAAALALRYEIRRDGQIVGTTDGVSYYTNQLEGDRDYSFEVIAVDRQGRRSEPSRIALRTTGGGTPVVGGPPAPADLRADVYSRRSAELFWQREAAALALRYEIRRDGQIVGTTDGVSYFTRQLAAGRDYAFEVIAIGLDGRRSAPSRIVVRTDGDPGPTEPGPTDPALAAPANLRADVYSSTATELFWDRAAMPGLRYEVSRDGAIVGTTDGTSFYDDGLSSATTYGYDVVALDADRRSDPSSVEVTTVGLGQSPTSGELAVEDGFTLDTRPEAIDTIDLVSSFFEELLPEERPYFVEREVAIPFSSDPFVLGETESVLIDIDASGTGSYRNVTGTESSDSISREQRIATRTNTGSAVVWSGTYVRTDSGSGRGERYEFTMETSALDGRLRQQSGTITAVRFGDGVFDRGPAAISYDLTTARVDGLRECAPVSGTIVYESGFVVRDGREIVIIETTTTISKQEEDRFWRSRVETDDFDDVIDDVLIRALALELFCDFPEL